MEFGFFSLFALSRKRIPHVLHELTTFTEQQISGDRFSQAVRSFDMTSRKSFGCYFWLYLLKHNLRPLINSPVSGHPPDFSLVSAYENNSRKRTVPLNSLL